MSIRLLLATVLGVTTTTGPDRPATPLDELLIGFIETHDVPGVAACVSRDGRHLYDTGFGWADVDAKRPVTSASRFRIASVSKPITAVAVLQLVERGRLSLDDNPFVAAGLADRIERAGADPRLRAITIRHVLHHAGGWDREEGFDPMFAGIRIAEETGTPVPATPDVIVRYMADQPLQFDPGSRYAYSNFGYCLLGRVIEAVSGTSYEAYVREHIARPARLLGLRLGASLPEDRQSHEVAYYAARPGSGPAAGDPARLVARPYRHDLSAMDAHGGWISSASDLVRFADAFNDPASCPLLSEASIELMFAPPPAPLHRDESGALQDTYYAMGWRVRPVGDGRSAWHHGGLPGTATLLVRRHDGLNWAVLFNCDRPRAGGADRRLADLVDGPMHAAVDRVSWDDVEAVLRAP